MSKPTTSSSRMTRWFLIGVVIVSCGLTATGFMLHGQRVDLQDALERRVPELARELQVNARRFSRLYDEAEGAGRLAILNEGRLVALGPPDELRSQVGGDSITIDTRDPAVLVDKIQQSMGLTARVVDDAVRLEVPSGHTWIARIVEQFPGEISSIRLGRPTLEDVFIAKTGHRFWQERRS